MSYRIKASRQMATTYLCMVHWRREMTETRAKKLTKSRQIFVEKLTNIVTFSSLLATYQDALMLQNCPQLNAHVLQWVITTTAALPDYSSLSSVVSVNTIYGQPPATVQPYTLTYWCPLQTRAIRTQHTWELLKLLTSSSVILNQALTHSVRNS